MLASEDTKGLFSAAPEFQQYVGQILPHFHVLTNCIDVFTVYGKTRDTHDRNLQATRGQLQDKGVKLNRNKSLLGVQKLGFFGYVLDEENQESISGRRLSNSYQKQ
ncbi:Pol polyprotein [Plakobranchus ocellatus]|uniref:Pol polyprotein n=1 Tax=Plakobranchus ocellatus TaxID=259542 RepID=A0AAV3XUC0_9GAST|nr:Pol polyprotein [Plakobranchus ocellatus]